MSGRTQKKIRKYLKANARISVYEIEWQIKNLPFYARLRLAWNVLFKKKLFSRKENTAW